MEVFPIPLLQSHFKISIVAIIKLDFPLALWDRDTPKILSVNHNILTSVALLEMPSFFVDINIYYILIYIIYPYIYIWFFSSGNTKLTKRCVHNEAMREEHINFPFMTVSLEVPIVTSRDPGENLDMGLILKSHVSSFQG